MNSALCGGVFVAVLMLSAAAGHAHTLASTIVSVTMTDPGTVTITISAEADPLIAKLEALAGIAASDPPATADSRRTRIESLSPTLRAHIDARVGGTPLTLELEEVAVDDTAQVEMHLIAKVAQGPHVFTWRSTFIFGAYQLATTTGSAAEAVEWLQGPQTSTPRTLAPSRSVVDGTAVAEASGLREYGIRIGHSLAMGALVIYVLRRRNARRRVRLQPDLTVNGWPGCG